MEKQITWPRGLSSMAVVRLEVTDSMDDAGVYTRLHEIIAAEIS